MQIPKFKEFFVEQDLERKSKPITVAIITIADSDDPKENTTADLISKACKKKGIKCIIVNTKTAIRTDKDEDKNTLTVYNYDGDGAKHTFVGKDTICMVRGGALQDEGGLSLISAFQNSQAFMINTRAAMLTCDNKLTSALLFEKFGVPTPRTAYVSNEKNLKTALDKIGCKFPVILKTLTGTQGVGVIKVESSANLEQVKQKAESYKKTFLMNQERLDNYLSQI